MPATRNPFSKFDAKFLINLRRKTLSYRMLRHAYRQSYSISANLARHTNIHATQNNCYFISNCIFSKRLDIRSLTTTIVQVVAKLDWLLYRNWCPTDRYAVTTIALDIRKASSNQIGYSYIWEFNSKLIPSIFSRVYFYAREKVFNYQARVVIRWPRLLYYYIIIYYLISFLYRNTYM